MYEKDNACRVVKRERSGGRHNHLCARSGAPRKWRGVNRMLGSKSPASCLPLSTIRRDSGMFRT